MIYLKTYKLFESIKNTKNVKFFIKKFLLDIKKSIGLKKSDFIFDIENPIYFKLTLFSKDEKLIDRLLKKYEKIFLDEGVVMSYSKSKENNIDIQIV